MSYCKNCGFSLLEYAAFCPNCGKAAEKAPEPVVADVPKSSFQAPPVVYDAAAFAIAKEYVSAVRSSRGLSITALVLMLSVIPAGVLTILIPFSTLLLMGMGVAAFICAIISGRKLGEAKNLPVIIPGSIDPVSFATYSKSLKDAKSARIMNIIVIVLFALAVVAVVAFMAMLLLVGDALSDAYSFSGPAYYY